MFSAGLVATYVKVLPSKIVIRKAVEILTYQRAVLVLTERGLSVQDEFVWIEIMKLCQTRCSGFIVEVPVNCSATDVFRRRRIAQYLK